MSNNSIDIQAVNSSVLAVPENTNKVTPSLSEAYFSLFLVLGFIIILALIVKKMGANTRFKKSKYLHIVDTISVGTKEKIVVIKQKDTLYTLGVTQSQITLLDKNKMSNDEMSIDKMSTKDNTIEDANDIEADKNTSLTMSFKKTLEQLINKKK